MEKKYTEKLKTNNVFKHYLFSYQEFNQQTFIKFIMENFVLDNTYSILITLGFNGNSFFYTCGNQLGIKITDYHDIDNY